METTSVSCRLPSENNRMHSSSPLAGYESVKHKIPSNFMTLPDTYIVGFCVLTCFRNQSIILLLVLFIGNKIFEPVHLYCGCATMKMPTNNTFSFVINYFIIIILCSLNLKSTNNIFTQLFKVTLL